MDQLIHTTELYDLLVCSLVWHVSDGYQRYLDTVDLMGYQDHLFTGGEYDLLHNPVVLVSKSYTLIFAHGQSVLA